MQLLPLRKLAIFELCLPPDGYRTLLSLTHPFLEEFEACICHSDDSDDLVMECIRSWASHLTDVMVRQRHLT